MIKFLANIRNHQIIFGLLLLLNVMLLVGRFYITQSVLGGDSVYYYSTIRSLVIDGNIDYRNEYQHFHREVSSFTGNPKIPTIPAAHPVTKRLPNRYPIGNAIALIPFFVIAHLLSLVLSSIGLPVVTDGYGVIYQLFTSLGSLLYGFLGLIIIYFLGRKQFDSFSFDRFSHNSSVAFVGTIAIWLATPLIYYMTMEPLMSHTTSMFFASLFVAIWYVTYTKPTVVTAIALGVLGGMLCITRYQDILFLLIPIGSAIAAVPVYPKVKPWGRRAPPHPLKLLLITLIAAALVICLQLYITWYLYGTPFTTGYVYVGDSFNWLSPKLGVTLFSSKGGLLLWSPILLFAIVGLILFLRKQILSGILLGITLLSTWYLISAWSSPEGGDSFGNRMMLSFSIVFAIGLMQFLSTFERQKILYRVILILFGIFVLINAVLAGLYCFRVIGNPY
jgi:hypothetical protein